MEIRVYEVRAEGFIPMLTTEKAIEIAYKEHARQPGEFTIQFPIGEYGANEFLRNRFVIIDRAFVGFVKDINKSVTAGSNVVKITGPDLKGMLGRKIVIPPHTFNEQPAGAAGYDAVSGDTETCIKHYWENNIGISAEPKRRLPFLHIGENLHRGIASDRYMARFNNLAEVTAELAESGKLAVSAGIDIADLDNEIFRFIFDVREPAYRVANEAEDIEPEESPVILSVDRKTALTMEWTDEETGSANAFYATRSGARFADEALTTFYVREGESEPEGIGRIEQSLSVSVSTPEAGNEYSEMERQARHSMQNYEPHKSLRAQINYAVLQRGRDYELGDYITVQNREWGIETDIQITELETRASGGERTITATLGNGKQGLIRLLKRDMANI